MKHIYQRYESDCFPTCLAMVANISYTKAIRLIHPCRKKGSPYLTHHPVALKVLRKLGFKVRTRYVKNLTALKQIAIIFLDIDGKDIWHVVVWDPKQKKVLDPYKK